MLSPRRLCIIVWSAIILELQCSSGTNGPPYGIDASCYLYKGAYSCANELARGLQTKEYMNFIVRLITMLRKYDIKPVVVFDGNKLPAKEQVNIQRGRSREESLRMGMQLWNSGAKAEAGTYFQKALKVTFNMVQQLIETLKDIGVEYVVAPFEADAQLAYLESKGFIQGVITEDSDLLVFGCKEVIYKLDHNGSCKVIKQTDLAKCLGIVDNFTFEYFRYMCIIAGCDYLSSLPGIGIRRAHTFIKKFSKLSLKIEEALPQIGVMVGLKSLIVPCDYVKKFQLANQAFLHQPVFDTQGQVECSLVEIPQDADFHFCKMSEITKLDCNILDFCLGNINPETGVKVNNCGLDIVQKGNHSIWGENINGKKTQVNADNIRSDEDDQDDENYVSNEIPTSKLGVVTRSSTLKAKVIRIEDRIVWTVPSFPVMDIDFTEVKFEYNGEVYNGLMNTCDVYRDHELIRKNVVCWSCCDIEIGNKTYIVLWKWEIQSELPSDWEESDASLSDISFISETDLSDEGSIDTEVSNNSQTEGAIGGDDQQDGVNADNDEIPFITHTLPFKVIGVTHSKVYQQHLEIAFSKLKESEQSVSAHIAPEPDNPKDSEAICVKINYGDGQFCVGYIAHELTKYIHPLLLNNKILKVRLGKIKFQTRWLRMGFYMSILITRNGEWEPFVQNAARHVKLY